MAIKDRPIPAAGANLPSNKKADTFVESAPDGLKKQDRKGSGRGVTVGNKEQIPVTIAPDLLDRLDDAKNRLGMSRSAVITLAVNQFLKSEIAQ